MNNQDSPQPEKPVEQTHALMAKCQSVHAGKGYRYWPEGFTNTHGKVYYTCPVHEDKGPIVQPYTGHYNQRRGCAHCTRRAPMSQRDYLAEFKTAFGDDFSFRFINRFRAGKKHKPSNQYVRIQDAYGRHKDYLACSLLSKKDRILTWVADLDKGITALQTRHGKERFVFDTKAVPGISQRIKIRDTYKNQTMNISIKALMKYSVLKEPEERTAAVEPLNPFLVAKCGSKGEAEISQWLRTHQIKFISQHTFADCRDTNVLRFDFLLYERDLLIEYDGIQHEKAIDFYGGEKGLKDRIRKDRIKEKYIHRKAGYNLERISYPRDIVSALKQICRKHRITPRSIRDTPETALPSVTRVSPSHKTTNKAHEDTAIK